MLKHDFLQETTLSQRIYIFLFSLLGLVYVAGLFVPLMDNDAAHHANIALHMYLHRDFVNLVDNGKDYLDKPHLHFWMAACSYKIFGVTSFAYRFPSFLFTIAGIYSTYRLGRSLYNANTGRIAALMLASSFAFMLANTDVRMDAILTACVAFATWQGVDFIKGKKLLNALGLAAGLALGFATKGHIAVLTPAVGLFFYIIYLREYKLFMNWKWLVVILLFGIFISPVVYCYYLQYNLHPEKIVRGKDHINGIKFILFGQSVERLQGDSFGSDAKNDYFFFFHSFLWAFAPWSILAYIAAAKHLRYFFSRQTEWLTISTLVVIALLLTFSGFKLPHYLNISFPASSVMTAAWLVERKAHGLLYYRIELIICTILLLLLGVINGWAFPASSVMIIIGTVLLLSFFFFLIRTERYTLFQKTLYAPVAVMVLAFFLLNLNFYPQLLQYQGGNVLAKKTKSEVDPANVYFWRETYSSSYNFYTATERKQFSDSLFLQGKRPAWLLYDIHEEKNIRDAGYTIGTRYEVPDFEITKLNIKFINPSSRKKNITAMVIGEITGKQ